MFWVQSLGQEDPLEEAMAIHSNILAWKIPWTEQPDGLQPMEWNDILIFKLWKEKYLQPALSPQ